MDLYVFGLCCVSTSMFVGWPMVSVLSLFLSLVIFVVVDVIIVISFFVLTVWFWLISF